MLERFVNVDYVDRLALVAELGDQLIGVARYDRLPDRPTGRQSDGAEAEVAFVDRRRPPGPGHRHDPARASGRAWPKTPASPVSSPRPCPRTSGCCGCSTRPASATSGRSATAWSGSPFRHRAHRGIDRGHARTRAAGRGPVGPPTCCRPAPSRSSAPAGGRAPSGTGRSRNLLAGGFAGPVYPVHPTAHHVASVRAYPTVLDIPDEIDLAVIVVPAAEVPAVVEAMRPQAGRRAGRHLFRFRRAGQAGRRARTATGGRSPPQRHAPDRPQLHGRHQHRPARQPQRHLFPGASDPGAESASCPSQAAWGW